MRFVDLFVCVHVVPASDSINHFKYFFSLFSCAHQTETLYNEIEQHFYSKPEKVEPLLKRAGVHDLSALLKRWLRELPQPLLADDLVHLFYQTHGELLLRKFSCVCLKSCESALNISGNFLGEFLGAAYKRN